MKIFSILTLCMLNVTALISDEFTLPQGAKIINRDDSGKTWQVNAVVDLSLNETKKHIHEALIKSKYKLKHEIPIDEEGKEHFIFLYVKGNEKLILMLWSFDSKRTYIAYGITK